MRDYSNDRLIALLPFPQEDAHKYSRGEIIIVAGSKKFPGAAVLAARSAQKMGAGYTRVVTSPDALDVIQGYYPSLVVQPWRGKLDQFIQNSSDEKPCAYVIGCGFDTEREKPEKLTYETLAKSSAPILLDGGALEYLTIDKGRLLCVARQKRGLDTVITPHVGEAERLAASLGIVAEDYKDLATQIAHSFGATVVLKSSDVYISDGEDVCVITQGTAVLAKAGTGDILSGIIGSLLAQNLEAFDACVLGTVLHADAGLIASSALTAISATPEDIIECIAGAIVNISEG